MKNKMATDAAWILPVIVLFSLVHLLSGTFAYVDGDDATSIAYHVMGRNDDMQRPYSPYHGMMDKFLGFLPPEENLLRMVGMDITRVANVFMVILILLLVFDWLDAKKKFSSAWHVIISFIVLLAVPEIFYLGLVYSPTLVAMCFALLPHLILRRCYQNRDTSTIRFYIAHAVSLLLFGLGVSFRWNVAVYGLVIAVDLILFQPNTKLFWTRLIIIAAWGILALVTSFLMINLSGYGIANFIEKSETIAYVSNQAGTLTSGGRSSYTEILLHTILTLSPMLSPIFALVALAGVVRLVWVRDQRGFLLLAGFLGILPWLQTGVPKFIITILPVLIFAFIFGLTALADYVKNIRPKMAIQVFVALGLIFPWAIGIRVEREGTAWGPGFALKPYDYMEVEHTRFGLTIGPGMAFPTPEGVRPLYGHGFVLLGEWRKFIDDMESERQNAIGTALSLGIPLLSTAWSPDYYLDSLYAMGFQTPDSCDRMAADGYFHQRRFTKPQSKALLLLFHDTEGDEIVELTSHLGQYAEADRMVIIGYPKTLRKFHQEHPGALQALGPTSAIVDLRKLASE